MKTIRKALSLALALTLSILAPGLHPYIACAQVLTAARPQPVVLSAGNFSLVPASALKVPAAALVGLPGTSVGVVPVAAVQAQRAIPAAAVSQTPVVSALAAAAKPEDQPPAETGRVLFDGTGLERTPVEISIPNDKLSDEQRVDAAGYAEVMGKRLFTWSKFPVQLPGTVFKGADQIIKVEDLFKAPTSDEVRRIGTSDDGKGPRLTDAQKGQIQETATFSVPSVEYPGLSHVWQLGQVLQKGQKAILDTFRSHNASALESVIVDVPDRIWHDQPLSLLGGLMDLSRAVNGLVGLAWGLTEDHPANTPAMIALEVERARVASLKNWAQGFPTIDLSLYDDKLMEAAAPKVTAAVNAFDAAWEKNVDAVRAQVEAELKKEGTPADQFAQAVVDRMVERYNAAFFTALSKDAALEAIKPGLGQLFTDHGKAVLAVRAGQADIERRVNAHAADRQKELIAAHPIKSKISKWLNEQVAVASQNYRVAAEEKFRQAIPELLTAAGLAQEAAIAEHGLAFGSGQGRVLSAKLESERSPNDVFSHSRYIWNPKNWKIEKVEREGEQTHYVLHRHELTQVTMQTGWRLKNLGVRFWVWTSNAMHALILQNLVVGPLGFQALVRSEPYQYERTVDQKTGQLIYTAATFNTLRSRIRGFYAQRRKALEEFYKKGDYGLLGQGFHRFLLFFPVDLGLGFIAPVVTGIGQPILTALNTALSVTLAVTAWLWAPITGLLWWALNAVIYDSEGTTYNRRRGLMKYTARVLPAVVHVFSGVTGVVKAIAGVGAAAWSLISAVGDTVFGAARTGLRQAWDYAMRGVISWRGRVPARDEKMIVRRIAGPGLTSEHFFQVSPELLLVAHQAALEADAVALYGDNAQGLIRVPRKVYEETLAAFGAVSGVDGRYSNDAPAFRTIGSKEKNSLETLSTAMKERQELYSRLLSVPNQSRIKLSLPVYESTMKKSILLTKNFYTKFFAEQGFDAAAVKAFWKAKSLAEGNWEGLAQAVMGNTFGWEIMVPLEENDKSFKIEVQSPTLDGYAKGLEDGMLPEDLAQIKLIQIGRGQPGREPTARVPKTNVSDVVVPGIPVK
ncbi:MAG: hypothetical protein AAB036_10075 [Elusimicrobiota bacterium]